MRPEVYPMLNFAASELVADRFVGWVESSNAWLVGHNPNRAIFGYSR
jgi:hypothetical protein